MTLQAKWLTLAVILMLLFFLAWTNRYEHVNGIGYLDRWTGRLVYLTEDGFKRDPFAHKE